MHQPSGHRHNVFPSRFASDMMLSAYLLGIFLVANPVAEFYTDIMPTVDPGDLKSRALTMLTWRV